MTKQQVKQVKQSWSIVAPLGTAAGELFYSELFQIAPQLRLIFPADIKHQSGKLTHMLSFIVIKLDKLDELVPEVKKLAARHNNYGVTVEHYNMVGAALLLTLEKALGANWTTELKQAWTAAYNLLSGAMIAGQLEAAA
jgi:hemoglobin-like flavoprotein